METGGPGRCRGPGPGRPARAQAAPGSCPGPRCWDPQVQVAGGPLLQHRRVTRGRRPGYRGGDRWHGVQATERAWASSGTYLRNGDSRRRACPMPAEGGRGVGLGGGLRDTPPRSVGPRLVGEENGVISRLSPETLNQTERGRVQVGGRRAPGAVTSSTRGHRDGRGGDSPRGVPVSSAVVAGSASCARAAAPCSRPGHVPARGLG